MIDQFQILAFPYAPVVTCDELQALAAEVRASTRRSRQLADSSGEVLHVARLKKLDQFIIEVMSVNLGACGKYRNAAGHELEDLRAERFISEPVRTLRDNAEVDC
jgi:hypothetical protein